MVKAVAFDADNTLYLTKPAAKPSDMAAMDVLSARAGKPAEGLYEEFINIVKGVKDSPDPAMRHRMYSYNKLSQKYGVDLAEAMYQSFAEKLLELIAPVPGIENILEKLKNDSIQMLVITEDNRLITEKKLSTLGLAKYFDKIISSDDTGTMKPSEKYYEALLEDTSPEEIMVVGDNFEKDLKIPKELGMKTLLVEQPRDLEKIL